jgi:Ca2+-binding RTX toxin-like protein
MVRSSRTRRSAATSPTGKATAAKATPAVAEALESRRLLASDLTAQISMAPGTYYPGDELKAQFSIQNLGTTTVTQDFNIRVTLSADKTLGNADDVKLIDIPFTVDLSNAFPVSYNWAVTVPKIAFSGDVYVAVKVDSGNAVAESNESNNTAWSNLGDIKIAGDSGVIPVLGTAGNDTIQISRENSNYYVKINSNIVRKYDVAKVLGFVVAAGDGDDAILVGNGVSNVYADGGNGNDKMVGSDGNENFLGGAGKDTLHGGAGNDRLNGSGGHDKLFGEGGADRLYGGDGNDYMDGGSSDDRFYGGGGSDTMYGQSGNDKFYVKDSAVDQLFGGSGTDSAEYDSIDVRSSIEGII